MSHGEAECGQQSSSVSDHKNLVFGFKYLPSVGICSRGNDRLADSLSS